MPIKNLGYACQNLSINENKKPKDKILTDRTCRLANFNIIDISELIKKNSADLVSIMNWNASNNVKFFRVSSNIFPFFDHPDTSYSLESLNDFNEIKQNFINAGKIASLNSIRLSCHPGPYTCIASPDESVCVKSLKTIEMHYTIGEMLNSKDFCINFHVGGAYKDKCETAKRFLKNFYKLDSQIQNRITIENDDKESMWSITDIYEKIYKECGVKIVLDIHHHRFRSDESLESAADLAFSTWGTEKPKVHYSESAQDKMPQAHSDFIENRIPELSKSVYYDVMIEAKQKDKALLKYRNIYNAS